jgi:hypothetical protein
MDVRRTLHAKPLGSLRCDQLNQVNKAVNKNNWKRGWRRRRKKTRIARFFSGILAKTEKYTN